MRQQVFLRIMGTETGEKSGYGSAENQKGKVRENAGIAGYQKSSAKLSGIVEQGAENAGDKDKMPVQKSVQQAHNHKAEKTAAQTVNQTDRLSGKKGGKKNACEQHDEGVRRSKMKQ